MTRDLLYPTNLKPGICDVLYLALREDITVLQDPDPGSIEIFENHQFRADRSFFKILMAPGKNSFHMADVGEMGAVELEQRLSFFVAGSYASVHATFLDLLHKPLIALIKDKDSGDFFQLGDSGMSAYLTVDFTTGTTRDGVKGYTVSISWINKSPVFYRGYVDYYRDMLFSATFLVDLYKNKIDENNLVSEYQGALSENIYYIYDLLKENAVYKLINIGMESGYGVKRNDLLSVDLTSFDTFLQDLLYYLSNYNLTDHLVLSQTKLIIESIGAKPPLMGIAIPGNMVDDGSGDIILLDDNLIWLIA